MKQDRRAEGESLDARSDSAFAEVADSTVLYDKVEPHIAKITLNRPERRNALLSPNMTNLLAARIEEANDDDDVKVVLLTGSGSHFCSGEDVRRTPIEGAGLKVGTRPPQSVRIRMAQKLGALHETLLYSSKVCIAVCQGSVVGAGLHLALSCDMIIASNDAQFSRPQSRIGLATFNTALPLFLIKFGINRGFEAMVTGRTMPAEELLSAGLISSIVPKEQLSDESMRYANAVSYLSTDGLMVGKQAMAMFWDLMGMRTYGSFMKVAHPLFTNLVWREDEFNFIKERDKLGHKEALKQLYQKWQELGFG